MPKYKNKKQKPKVQVKENENQCTTMSRIAGVKNFLFRKTSAEELEWLMAKDIFKS